LRHLGLFILFLLFGLLITRSSSGAVFVNNHVASDTIPDTAKAKKQDSAKVKHKKKPPLDAKVDYHARDSIRLDAKIRKVYLYGDADVKYENLELKAAYIDILLDSNIAYAVGIHDSGKIIGRPEFHQGSDVFHADEIRYNFKTKKGRINNIDTKEGEGYIHGAIVKKDSSNVYYMKNGRYTTCDKEADPHFFIAAYKLKVIPNNQVVTGPAMLYLEGVPTPLAIPFGFFPLTNGRHSGIVIPSYGESQSQGFYLQKGGYYLGLNDNFGTELLGDIYTNGSWALRDEIDYSNRYHYQGTFNLAWAETITPITGTSLNSSIHDYQINWQNTQDTKARPNSTFYASVNMASSTFNQNTSYDPTTILQNTLASNIRFTQDFPRTPFHLSLSASNNENTQDNSVIIDLPQMVFTVDRVYPFKKPGGTGTVSSNPITDFYRNLSIGLTSNADNRINTTQADLFTPNTLNQMQNGISNSVPLSTNFTLFKHLTTSLNATYTPNIYFQTIRESWVNFKSKLNPETDSAGVKTDTVQRLQTSNTFNTSATLTTTVYGMYSLGLKKAIIIRQVFYPSVSFSYHPDYSQASYNYYRSVANLPAGQMLPLYSIFQNEAIAAGPGAGKFGAIGLSLSTNLEMKVRTRTDSGIVYKKIKLLERFGISTGYNMMADSLKWEQITISGNTTLFKKLGVNFSGNIDPYYEGANGADINRSIWSPGDHDIGRLTSAELSLSTTLTSATANSKNKGQTTPTTAPPPNTTPGAPPNKDGNVSGLQLNSPSDYFQYEQMRPLYWAPIEIAPWSLTMIYTYAYTVSNFQANIGQSLTFNGSMQLSKYWYVAVVSGYDVKAMQFTQTSLSATRDMHCWQLTFTSVPFGYRQSFMLNVHVKASVLSDLKLQRTRSWQDTQEYSQ